MTLVKVRCPTPTRFGVCNRWQFEISEKTPDGIEMRFQCRHCRQTTLMLSSEATRPVPNGVR